MVARDQQGRVLAPLAGRRERKNPHWKKFSTVAPRARLSAPPPALSHELYWAHWDLAAAEEKLAAKVFSKCISSYFKRV
jgi:hypothetical protein